MKLYHYAPKENTVMRDGLFSISKIDRNLRPYINRTGSENKVDASKDLLYAVIRHYLIVLKDGYIPSKYITKE